MIVLESYFCSLEFNITEIKIINNPIIYQQTLEYAITCKYAPTRRQIQNY